MIRNLRFLSFLLFIFFSIPSIAQLVVTPNVPINTLIGSLVGNGAQVSNPVLNCPGAAFGTFTASSSNLGITSGVLLTTGSASLAVGPNFSGSAGTTSGNSGSDPNLISLEPEVAGQDHCVLEFDIIPSCNELNIDYVFGSEEYPEFVGLGFNDVFGFFISGINPGGGSYVNQNIALIPSTSTPVAINSVNDFSNSGYYVDNTGGGTIQYDGFTTLLTARALVVPCSTYHMKIAIADAGDNIYDSGVFFAYQGLNCPTAPDVTLNVNNATVCPGEPTSLTASGSTTYTWSPPTGLNTTSGPNVIATPTSTTTYTVTGSAGCSITTETVIITVTSPIINAGADVTICNGFSTTLGASGGTSYSWSPATGLSATNISNPVASPTLTTTYTVTGSTSPTCVGTDIVVVTVNSGIVTAPSDVSVCPGGSTTLTATGATTYTWSPSTGLSTTTGATTTSTPASTITYTVTGTTNSCIAIDEVIVSVGTMSVIASSDTTICPAGNAQLNANGGTSFTWNPATALNNPNIQNPIASPVSTTTYTVTGTSGTCTGTDIVIVNIGAITVDAGNDVTICAGTSTTLSSSGATIYNWSPTGSLDNAAINNPTASPSATTTYTVTGSSGTCSDTDEVIVNVTPLPAIIISPDATICSGSATSLTASGATNYSWSPVGGLSDPLISNPVASPASTTTYTVTGTQNGCSDTASVVVTVNPIPVITTSNDTTICPGGTASLTVNGGTTYSWSPSTALSSTSISNPTSSPASTITYTVTGTLAGCINTDEVIVTVLPGDTVYAGPDVTICDGTSTNLLASGATTYSWNPVAGLSDPLIANPIANPVSTTTYTVTGTNGSCTNTDTIIVIVNPIPVITAGPNSTVCAGTSAIISGAGATSYNWSPSTGLSDPTIANPTATPSSTTTYTVTGTLNGCSDTAQAVVYVNPIPVISAGTDTTICSAGTATLNATGGTSYSWSPATGLSSTSVNNPLASPTITTTYTVTGTLAGCTSTDEVIVNVIPPVNPFAGNDTIICYGTSAQLHATGATNYSWSPVGTLSNQNISNPVASPLTTTTYTVTGTISGCTGIDQMIVNVPARLIITPAAYDATCYSACNGQAIAVPSGGTSPYSFSWSTTPATITPALANACAGTYTVSVTDFFGCSSDTTVIVGEPPQIFTSDVTTAAHCFHADGNATATASGGTPGFSYTWDTSPIQISPTANNLTPGTYTYTVTDNSNCILVDTVVIKNLTGVVASINNTTNPPVNTTCFNACDGSATASGTGGTLPYNYTWQTAPFQISPTASNLCAGTYSVIISDANFCLDTVDVIITQPSPVSVIASASDTICIGQSTNISANSSGGTPGYTYTWWPATGLSNTTTQSPTASNTVTSTYSVSSSDANNCQSDTSLVIIAVNPPLNVVATTDQSICINDTTTVGVFAGSGGSGGPYTYTWEPNTGLSSTTGSAVNANPSSTTTYTVIIDDNCTSAKDSDIVVVNINPLPIVTFTTPDNDGCYPHTTNFENTTTGAVSCNWTFGDGNTSSVCSPTNTFTNEGSYDVSLTVTDLNGCVNTYTNPGLINVYGYPEAFFSGGPQPTTILNPTIEFQDLSTGNPVSWQWYFNELDSSAQQNPSYTFQDTGFFPVQLIIQNQYGCQDDTTLIIRIDPDFVFFAPNAFTPNGDNLNDKFMPVGFGWVESKFEMMIFDRWGNLLYQTTDMRKGWDGKANNGSTIAQEDVYIWRVSVTPINEKGIAKMYSGSVTLLK